MKFRLLTAIFSTLCACLIFPGCGGGTSGSNLGGQTVTIRGKFLSVQGSPIDSGKVIVTETGSSALSGIDGSYELLTTHFGTLTLLVSALGIETTIPLSDVPLDVESIILNFLVDEAARTIEPQFGDIDLGNGATPSDPVDKGDGGNDKKKKDPREKKDPNDQTVTPEQPSPPDQSDPTAMPTLPPAATPTAEPSPDPGPSEDNLDLPPQPPGSKPPFEGNSGGSGGGVGLPPWTPPPTPLPQPTQPNRPPPSRL